MSIVVAARYGKQIAMACDTMQSFGSMKQLDDNIESPKIRKVGTSLIGGTGWGVYDNILLDFISRKRVGPLNDCASIYKFFLGLWKQLRNGDYGFVKEQRNDDDSPFVDLDASFLVVNEHGIFRVGSDLGVLACKQYWAIGSGAPYAFGAIHTLRPDVTDPATLARRACEAAMHFDDSCGGDVLVMQPEKAKTRRAARRR